MHMCYFCHLVFTNDFVGSYILNLEHRSTPIPDFFFFKREWGNKLLSTPWFSDYQLVVRFLESISTPTYFLPLRLFRNKSYKSLIPNFSSMDLESTWIFFFFLIKSLPFYHLKKVTDYLSNISDSLSQGFSTLILLLFWAR